MAPSIKQSKPSTRFKQGNTSSAPRQKPPRDINAYRLYWAECFGVAPFLPTTRAEMEQLGWDSCDIIIVTGDAYVDHASFGMAVIGRVLEAQGFRVGIIAQPDWTSKQAFQVLGRPNLFFGVTAGNMDSMVNHYTAEKRIRHDDAYTPGNVAGKRPDRAVIVYSQRCQEAFKGIPVVIGSIEASLRRIAHYDYWSDKVRRSVLMESKADMLLYGNAERAIVELAHRISNGEKIKQIKDIRGTAYVISDIPTDALCIEASALTGEQTADSVLNNTDQLISEKGSMQSSETIKTVRIIDPHTISAPQTNEYIRLPSFEQVRQDKVLYGHASRILHRETNPGNARALVQAHGERFVWLNPPPIPLSTPEMDWVFGLPFQRVPHPSYGGARIPAYEMIRFSINIMRGCFGGCTFCSITEHEGRIIQSRSEESILSEIENIRDKTPGFTGVISDLGGPTANMWRLACKSKAIETRCKRLSCIHPSICKNLNTDQTPLISLYRRARAIKGVKKVLIASGLRYDLAVETPEYVKELVTEHVGGYLKIAPEHTESGPLSKMMKPGMGAYNEFKALFDKFSRQAGKEQYLIPYFIAAHPGTTDSDMMNLAIWLKRNDFRADQVQNFYPSPMSTATAMYHSRKNPLKRIGRDSDPVSIPKGTVQRRLHKAFLRYHDPDNWPLLREALKKMGHSELIGNGKKHLVPAAQSGDSGSYRSNTSKLKKAHQKNDKSRRKSANHTAKKKGQIVKTQHTGLPKLPGAPIKRSSKKKRHR
ncbi:MAG: YgiQ family radical SAM protein [Pseudomonadales bacterium]|nr:YgiQ family radical SAM protein [Pseudomonadales bacterium]